MSADSVRALGTWRMGLKWMMYFGSGGRNERSNRNFLNQIMKYKFGGMEVPD